MPLARAGRAPWLWGALAAIGTAALYFVGAGRAYNLDASATVGNFVATDSLLDPLREQVVYNNHVLFSFLDHLVYTATGSADEVVLRALPIAATALAVGLLTGELARRLGRLAALSACALVLVNPLMIDNCREVRGYGFLLLSAVAASVLLVRLREAREPSRALVAAYVLALAAGIATHVYAVAVLAVHVAVVGPDRAELRRWAPRWAAALALGVAPLLAVVPEMLEQGRTRGRVFQAGFPRDLARELLGGAAVTALLYAPLVALGGGELLRAGWARRTAGALVVLTAAVWVVAPRDLYPRLFVWLVPVVALLVAVAVRRRPVLAVLVVALVAVQAVRAAPDLTRSELGNRRGAQIADQVARAGGTPCALGLSGYALDGYTRRARTIGSLDRLGECDVVLQVFTPLTPESRRPAPIAAAFPHTEALPAEHSGIVSSRVPLACWRRSIRSAACR